MSVITSGKTIYGIEAAQDWKDLAAWELFFNRYNFNSLFEFGTGSGAMSIWLAAQCYMRGHIQFTTHDLKPGHLESFQFILKKFRSDFRSVDVVSQAEGMRRFIRIAPKPFCLFLNVPDPSQLAAYYIQNLQPGDYLVLQQWKDKFALEDMYPYLSMLMEADVFRLGCKSLFYKKMTIDEIKAARNL